jgi:predicted dithiol-disulfide oxidoreductase (DUF899 family)
MATRKRKKKTATRKRRIVAAGSLHSRRFPAETPSYRRARNELLAAEMKLRQSIEAVAALRRKLPPGGLVLQDYVFTGVTGPDQSGPMKLSELFAPGKHVLAIYSFMYGPKMERACPSCTSMLDSLDGAAPHVSQRVNLVVVAKSPLSRILAFARERGWRRLRLLSSSGNSYNQDYWAESADGAQMPMLNVFVKRGEEIRHFWGSEMLYAPWARGQHPRHIDSIWPLWNLLDVTPEGRGTDWHPKLDYRS